MNSSTTSTIHTHVPLYLYIGRWVLEDLHIYNPYNSIINNQSESLNLKELQGWKEVKIDNAVPAFYQMQTFYSNEITRRLAGIQYSSVVSGMKEIELFVTC